MNAPRESKKTAREKAAAARAQAQAAEKRRERTVRIIGAVAVLAVVGVIISIGVIGSRSGGDSADASASASADPAAALPEGVLAGDSGTPYGVPYGTAPATAPVLELWEDFQCPACGQLEASAGTSIEQLAQDGKVQLVWRPTTFLDGNLGNDASKRATAAWGCAIDAGVTREFHNTVYANQPATEGDGWTDEQLLQFGSDAGLEGADLTAFEKCYTDRTYLGWALNSTDAFTSSNIPGTPNAILNGTELPTATLLDPAELEKAITAAAASQ